MANSYLEITVAVSLQGQRVKKVLFPSQCPNLLEGDVIVELDGRDVRHVGHTQLVDILRECPLGHTGVLLVRRSSPKHRYFRNAWMMHEMLLFPEKMRCGRGSKVEKDCFASRT